MPKRGPSPKELEREILLRRISELAVQRKERKKKLRKFSDAR